MNSVFHIMRNEKNVLFRIDIADKYFFSGEMIYPFDGIKFDYFNDENIFDEETLFETIKKYVWDIHSALLFILQEFYSQKELNAKFIAYNRGSVNKKENLRKVIATPLFEAAVHHVSLVGSGKTFRKSVIAKFVELLDHNDDSKFHLLHLPYSEVFADTLEKYKTVRSIDQVCEWNYQGEMHDRFFKKIGDKCHKLKMLNTCNLNHQIPSKYYERCSEDEFVTETCGILPLFIETQFGVSPRADNEILKKLEGQRVVFLAKSQLSGCEFAMILKEVINGKFQEILKVKK